MKITEILREYDITSYRKGDELDPRSPHYEEPPEDEQSTEVVSFPWDAYDAEGQEVVASGTVTAEVEGTTDYKGNYKLTDVTMLSFVTNGRTYDRHNALATFGRQAFDTRDMVDDAEAALKNL
jgi:hypothetical protein